MLNQQRTFADRLSRISTHSGHTNATLHIGSAEQLHQAALMRAFRGEAELPAKRGVASTLALMGVSLVTGGVAWVWAHWARVTVLESVAPGQALAADLAATLLFIFVLRTAFGFTGLATLVVTLTSALLAMATLHNAVHLWPQTFTAMFPPDWVASVLETTQPMTVSLAALPL